VPRHRILHLSDTHLTASGRDEDGVETTAALERILYDARHIPGLDLVVVSGDIADDGSAAGYAAARDRIGAFAASLGIAHVYCTGNHDERTAFAAELGSGHLGPDCVDVGRLASSSGTGRVAVSEVSGLRVITLDSLVPGSVHGLLSDGQLTWLREVLARPVAAGTVVVVHHPPIYLESSELMQRVGLRNADALAEVLRGSDVRAVLCGHFHLQLTGSLAGVPVWAGPAVATRIDLTTPPHLERAVTGAGATVVDLGGPFSPTFHVFHARDPRAGEQVYLLDALSGVDVESESPA